MYNCGYTDTADRSSTLLTSTLCSVNSVDRMPLLQSGSRWFESITEHHIIPDRLIGKSSVFGTEDSTFDLWSGNICIILINETIYKVAVQGPLAGVTNGRLGYVEGCG